MALIKCHECGKKVSTEAAACPSCGAVPRVPISKPTNWGRWVLIIGAAWAGIAVYGAINDWQDRRAAKKAEYAEMRRRESLTSAQRVAEDEAKAIQAAIKKENDAREARRLKEAELNRSIRYVCLESIKRNLYDPSSFSEIETVGGANDATSFDVFVTARAKNAMGALIIANWKCSGRLDAENIAVTGVQKYSR